MSSISRLPRLQSDRTQIRFKKWGSNQYKHLMKVRSMADHQTHNFTRATSNPIPCTCNMTNNLTNQFNYYISRNSSSPSDQRCITIRLNSFAKQPCDIGLLLMLLSLWGFTCVFWNLPFQHLLVFPLSHKWLESNLPKVPGSVAIFLLRVKLVCIYAIPRVSQIWWLVLNTQLAREYISPHIFSLPNP